MIAGVGQIKVKEWKDGQGRGDIINKDTEARNKKAAQRNYKLFFVVEV